jgi:hypothetical protein
VAAAVVVALAAIGGIVYALGPGSGNSDDNAGPTDSTASAAATPGSDPSGGDSPGTDSSGGGYRPPEPNRTMDSDACTDAFQDYSDAKKVDAPDFRYKDIRSVKACMNKVGWTVKETDVDNGAYADGQVLEQYPAPGDPVDPKSQVFDLNVSTGKPE